MLEALGAILGPYGGHLEAIWMPFGGILALLGPQPASLGRCWADAWPILGQFGAEVGPKKAPSWVQDGLLMDIDLLIYFRTRYITYFDTF